MTVIELIHELNKYPSDAVVLRAIPETDGRHTESIEKAELHDTDYGLVIVLE